MRLVACQFGLSLTVLLTGSLLGGSQAHAAFLVRAHDSQEVASGMSASDDMSPTKDEPAPKAPPAYSPAPGDESLWWGSAPQSGNGFGGVPGGASGVGPTPAATISSPVPIPAAHAVRWFYYVDVQCHPPPFASRLFRPPRLD
jgi:hypothetical protein